MDQSFFVYILANRPRGVMYVGVTNDLLRRVAEHKGKFVPGFTRRYGVTRLVYYEEYRQFWRRESEKASSNVGVVNGSSILFKP